MAREAKNLQELRGIAQDFLMKLKAQDGGAGALVVGLKGDLGAGKTAFTKCVAELLGITETITSPTFILEKIYPLAENNLLAPRINKLVHIDAYRLDHGDDLRPLDWENLLNDSGALVLLEWPEQVSQALPSQMVELSFEYVDEGVRRVKGDMIN